MHAENLTCCWHLVGVVNQFSLLLLLPAYLSVFVSVCPSIICPSACLTILCTHLFIFDLEESSGILVAG